MNPTNIEPVTELAPTPRKPPPKVPQPRATCTASTPADQSARIAELERRVEERERTNEKLALVGGEAVALLREWLIGGECFCTPEGCASRQPCPFCKTTAFIAASDPANDDPYQLTVCSLLAELSQLRAEVETLQRERDEAVAEHEVKEQFSDRTIDFLRAQLAEREEDRAAMMDTLQYIADRGEGQSVTKLHLGEVAKHRLAAIRAARAQPEDGK